MAEELGPYLGDEYGDLTVLRHALSLVDGDGWALEFGTGSGASTRAIAEYMPVITFDSFDGLPEDWRPDFPAGMFRQATIPQIEDATVVVGLFADTLPAFDWPDEVALVHLDADLFSSTATILEHAGHLLVPGVLVVLDEYHGYTDDLTGETPGEQRAFHEWAIREGVDWDVIGHGREQLAVRITGGSL